MRRLISLLATMLVLALLAPGLSAQDATPASSLDDLGLPTLDVTVTADGYEGIPESLEAGRYLVTVTAAEEAGEFGGGAAFVQPAGMTGEEFVAFLGGLAGGPDESGVGSAAATPVEGGAATPDSEGGEMGGVPAFYYESLLAGGAWAPAGESTQVVLDLPPGEWVAWGDDPTAAQEPFIFEATGDMPTDLPEPDSSATLTMGEYLIAVTDGELTSGQQLVRIDNVGAQPHFIVAGTTQVDVTESDIAAVLEAEMTGTPAAVDFDPDADFADTFSTGSQSRGTSIWVPVDLESGNLVLLCFFPDISDGMPHTAHGMYDIIAIP